MSETWLGLHNPDRHRDYSGIGNWASCLAPLGGCGSDCLLGNLCRCCLEAELVVQTARADAAEQRIENVRAVLHQPEDECRCCQTVRGALT